MSSSATTKLIIGNKNYSSWSLRAWLSVKVAKMDFEEVRIPLYTSNYKEKLLEHSPAGRVPVLVTQQNGDERLSVWDSLAIMEFVLEQCPDSAIGWPKDATDRARARSIAYEMHSGFLALRDELPQNLKLIQQPLNNNSTNTTANTGRQVSSLCQSQIQRVDEIWKTCLDASGGPWLFGHVMTIADLMFVPVALRFVSHGVTDRLSAESQKFIETVASQPLVQEWIHNAKQETEVMDFIDNLVPAAESPLIL